MPNQPSTPWWLICALLAWAIAGAWWGARRGLWSLRPTVRPALPEEHARQEAQASPLLPLAVGLLVWIGTSIAALVGLIVSGGALAGQAGAEQALSMPQQAVTVAITYALGVVIALAAWAWLGRRAVLLDGLGWPDAPARVRLARGVRNALRGLGWLIVCAPLLLLAGMASQWVWLRMTGAPAPTIAHSTLAQIVNPGEPVWARATLIVAVVVGAPIVEEVIYRGCLQTAAWRAAGVDSAPAGRARAARAWLTLLVLALVFAAIHANAIAHAWFPAGVALVTLALLLGAVYARTRSVAAVTVMHAGFNLANVCAALLVGEGG